MSRGRVTTEQVEPLKHDNVVCDAAKSEVRGLENRADGV